MPTPPQAYDIVRRMFLKTADENYVLFTNGREDVGFLVERPR